MRTPAGDQRLRGGGRPRRRERRQLPLPDPAKAAGPKVAAAVSTRWPAPQGRLVPDRLTGSDLSGAGLDFPPVSPRDRNAGVGARLRALRHFLSAAFGYGSRNPKSFRFSPGLV